MARVSGPLIAAAGGWYVRYFGGTPVNVSFTDMQINHDAVMLLAIPYPATTTFKIYGKAPSWCNPVYKQVCTHDFRNVGSVAAVRAAYGDAYYFDTAKTLLYLRIVELSSFGSYFATTTTVNSTLIWNVNSTKNSFFARGPLKLLVTGSGYWSVNIEASNCGAVSGKCAFPATAAVPAALTPVPVGNLRLEETDQQTGNSNVGALVGGIVGGVVGLVLVGMVVAFVILRKDKTTERV